MGPLFIAGTPASGKTTFGDYLQSRHGFLHLDLEAKQEHRNSLHDLFDHCLNSGRLPEFFTELLRTNPRAVVTCGLPVSYLFLVSTFRNHGAECWWFVADLELAEREWVKREGRQPMGPEREQFDRLRHVGSQLPGLFGENIITTLSHSGRTPNEDIYAHIFRTSVQE